MRKEHKPHALLITFMLFILLVIIIFLLASHNSGFTPSMTTSLTAFQTQAQTAPASPASALAPTNAQQATLNNTSATQNELQVLFGLLILLAFFGVVYAVVKIATELKKHHLHH